MHYTCINGIFGQKFTPRLAMLCYAMLCYAMQDYNWVWANCKDFKIVTFLHKNHEIWHFLPYFYYDFLTFERCLFIFLTNFWWFFGIYHAMTNSCHAEQLTLTCHAELVSACITNLVSLTDAGIHISLTLSCSLALNGSAVRSLPPLRPLLAHAVLFARSKRVCGAELSASSPSARSRCLVRSL